LKTALTDGRLDLARALGSLLLQLAELVLQLRLVEAASREGVPLSFDALLERLVLIHEAVVGAVLEHVWPQLSASLSGVPDVALLRRHLCAGAGRKTDTSAPNS